MSTVHVSLFFVFLFAFDREKEKGKFLCAVHVCTHTVCAGVRLA